VYVRRGSRAAPQELTFMPLSEPSAADVQELAERTASRLARVLRAHGRYLEDQDGAEVEPDALGVEQPALAACYQAAASGRALDVGPSSKPIARMLVAPRSPTAAPSPLCAEARGVNVHASAAVPARDRARLLRLCRYAARPPLPQQRLEQLADGRIRLGLRKPWSDGTSAFVLSPQDLIARLCAAVPPPRFHLLRFHGVLAAASALRPLVVPRHEPDTDALPATEPAAPAQLPLFEATPAVASVAPAPEPEAPAHEYKGRHPWAVLLRHTFALDVTACAHCQGRMTRFVIPEGVRLVELCVTAEAVQRVLRHAGPGPPPAAPPRRPRVHATQLRLPLHAG
jgi:hypothetical protein